MHIDFDIRCSLFDIHHFRFTDSGGNIEYRTRNVEGRKRTTMKYLILAAAFSFGVVVLPETALAQRDPGMQAPLLAKGEDFLVHAVPQADGYVITHLVPSTGVMKALAMSSHPEERPMDMRRSRGGRGARFDRASERVEPTSPSVHIVAAAADEKRLYVLLRVAGMQRGGVYPVSGDSDLLTPHVRLQAFSLADGAPLLGPNGYAIQSEGSERDGRRMARLVSTDEEKPLEESLSAGPLALEGETVSVLGTSLTFEGGTVSNLKIDDREFSPPPGFFDERRMLR
jgi:hypothetical protein